MCENDLLCVAFINFQPALVLETQIKTRESSFYFKLNFFILNMTFAFSKLHKYLFYVL